jgi:hypothetical protein
MSFVDEIVKSSPGKYNTIIKSRVLDRTLELKIKQYNALQTEYDNLIRDQTINAKPPSGGWKRINGGLKQISGAGKDYIWGVTKYDSIYTCKKPCDDSNWRLIGGSLKQLSGGENEVWGVNSNNNIYKMNQDGTGGWTGLGGPGKNVSQGGGFVWLVGGEGKVWYCRQPCNGEWVLASMPKANLGWEALGNWKDNGNRMLPNYKGIYTKAGCNQQCQGKKYFSLQDGNGHAGQCFCGSDWNRITSLGTCDQDNKVTGGGWCNTVYNTTDGSTYIPIHVGSSSTNNKVVTLPYEGMTVNKWQVNAQNPGWGDRFRVKVNGNQLTVTRIDANAGWGEDLYLEGIVQPDPSKVGPPMIQLSCNNRYVYGLDTNKTAWRRPINGSGSWEKFGNPTWWQFYWINASNNKDVFAIGMTRQVYKTDIDGKKAWSLANKAATGVATVSGDPDSADFYITNTSDAIYRHSPKHAGGFWQDIPNENYQMDMVNNPTESNENWKFLGKQNNVDECKLKAVEDKNQEYANVVYYPEDFPNEWKKSCFGGVKGGKINAQYQSKTITSLAPNGTSRLGGKEGEKLLNQMNQKSTEIENLIKEQQQTNLGAMRTNNLLESERKTMGNQLEDILEKLRKDRIEINKIINQPNESSAAEDGYNRQLSNYFIYFSWILLVVISVGLAVHLISSESVSVITYIFVAIWVIILAKYYYKQVAYYSGWAVDSISSLMIDTVN